MMTGDLHFGGESQSRASFEDRARRGASVLKANGVEVDDTIAILLRNDLAYLETIEACRYAGARYAALNWHAAPLEIAHILEDSGAKVLVGHADLLEPLADLNLVIPMISVAPSQVLQAAYGIKAGTADPATDYDARLAAAEPYGGAPERYRGLFAYTSGSTGRPKGIRREMNLEGPDTYEVFSFLAQGLLQAQDGDSMHIAAPLYHSAPNALSQFVLASGFMQLHLAPRFDPEAFLADVERHGLTHAYLVPTMMVRLLKLPEDVRAKYDVSSLRFTISTGAPCPVDVKKAMIDWLGPIVYETYGASEIGFMTLIGSEDALAKPGSVGQILPGGSLKILDDDMNELPAGETGAIYVHLPQFGDFTYSNAEGAMADQRYQGHVTLGDVGRVDEDGFLFISDRKKDMIITGGANVFPAEIEAQLIQMPEVADCAVFGAPDPEFGERIVAAVTLKPGASLSLESMRAFLEPRLASFKIPRVLDVHDDLPREDSGKIFKARLREPYWAEAGRSV